MGNTVPQSGSTQEDAQGSAITSPLLPENRLLPSRSQQPDTIAPGRLSDMLKRNRERSKRPDDKVINIFMGKTYTKLQFLKSKSS